MLLIDAGMADHESREAVQRVMLRGSMGGEVHFQHLGRKPIVFWKEQDADLDFKVFHGLFIVQVGLRLQAKGHFRPILCRLCLPLRNLSLDRLCPFYPFSLKAPWAAIGFLVQSSAGNIASAALKDDVVRMRVTGDQKRALEDAAHRAGLELSAWLRQLALREAGALPKA